MIVVTDITLSNIFSRFNKNVQKHRGNSGMEYLHSKWEDLVFKLWEVHDKRIIYCDYVFPIRGMNTPSSCILKSLPTTETSF